MAYVNGNHVVSACHHSGYDDGLRDGRFIGFNDGVIEGIEQGIETGKHAEYDRFWDAYQIKGVAQSCISKFAGEGWTDEIYNPKYTIKALNASNLFAYNRKITDTKVDIDVSSAGANSTNMFYDCISLQTIRYLKVVYNTNMSTSFTNCVKLANIVIDGEIGRNCNMEWCPLTGDSIRSVINALSDTATGYTVTFKKTAKESAFTDEEWETLKSTKSNWNFELK